jgi:hypothetical protein
MMGFDVCIGLYGILGFDVLIVLYSLMGSYVLIGYILSGPE